MIGIKATVTLERTLYIDVPDDATPDEKTKKMREEIILPLEALQMANKALIQVNIRIPKLDLPDWEMTDSNINLIE